MNYDTVILEMLMRIQNLESEVERLKGMLDGNEVNAGKMNTEGIRNYIENLKNIKIEITGEDLQKLGVKPSPKYKECFDKILEAKCYNSNLTKQDEIMIVKEYFGI